MSYTVAPTFEGNRLGIRRLRTLSGIGGEVSTLGDAGQDALVQQLIAGGFSAGDLNTLIYMQATNTDLANLLNGTVTVGGLMNTLTPAPTPNAITGGNVIPKAPPPPAPALTTPGSIPYSMTPPQIPSGSTLLYTVAYIQTLLTLANVTLPASSVASQLASQLPQYGMSVLQSTVTDDGPQTFGITFSIQVTGGGFAQQNDAYSILHSLMQRIVGATITSDPMSIVSAGAMPFQPGGSANLNSAVSSYWPWIAGGALAAVLIGMIIEKKT